MAKHTGRGIAAIEYPTGMNQNGDPSQAWIKVKPDGRVDVFAGTSDIGNGSKTIQSQIVAETIGVPYDWITYDNSNTDSSPGLHRHVRVARDVRRRQGGREGGRARPGADPRHRGQGARDRPVRPRDRRRRGAREGRAAEEDRRPRRRGRRDVDVRRADHGDRRAAEAVRRRSSTPRRARSTSRRTRRSRTRRARRRSRSTTRPAIVRVTRLVQVYDVGRAINPTLVEGQIEGGAVLGLGLGVLENCYPYYPSVEHRGGEFGSYLAPGIRGPAADRHDHHREPVRRRPVRREGDRRDGEQRAAARDRGGGLRRGRRLGDGAADHAREGAARARGEGAQPRARRARRSCSTRTSR